MLKLPKNFILFDGEFTAWEGSWQRKWSGPGEYMELVQIGAIKVDGDKFIETESFTVFVKPEFNPKLSDYFINLTGITQEDVDKKGTDLESAIIRFKNWCGQLPVYSYGGDESVIQENFSLAKIVFPFSNEQFHDIKDVFESHGIQTKKYSSGEITEAFGKKSLRRGHDGLNDARTILDGLIELNKRLSA